MRGLLRARVSGPAGSWMINVTTLADGAERGLIWVADPVQVNAGDENSGPPATPPILFYRQYYLVKSHRQVGSDGLMGPAEYLPTAAPPLRVNWAATQVTLLAVHG